jgi:hypothetical protein
MADSDDELKKWDADVRGNVRSSGSIDSPTSPAPSATRIKKSHRSLKSDHNFSNQSLPVNATDITLSLDVADPLGVSSHDGSDHYNDDDDEAAAAASATASQRYIAGRPAAPDQTFAATQLIHLTRGNTAYKIIESEGVVDDRGNSMEPITIVCLHGLTDSSYIWEDVAEVLSCSDAGPCARVVVFDFYGRGRFSTS